MTHSLHLRIGGLASIAVKCRSTPCRGRQRGWVSRWQGLLITSEHCLASLILAIYCVAAVAAAGDKPVAELFEELVKAEGADYVRLRDELVGRGDTVKPFLNGVRDGAGDWRQKLTAKIVLGWIDHADLYKQLWVWQPPRNGNRNRLMRRTVLRRRRNSPNRGTGRPFDVGTDLEEGRAALGGLPAFWPTPKWS